jgi:hypothetical protein
VDSGYENLMAEADPHPYIEPMHPVQIEGFRKMTVAQKLDMIWGMRETGICLRIAGLRMRHPDWSEEKLELEARRWAMCATT